MASRDGKVKTHNVQHSLRAASRKKTAGKLNAEQAPPARQPGLQDPHNVPKATVQDQRSSREKEARMASESNQQSRKTVYKQVLGSPLTVNWPAIKAVDTQTMLYTLLDVLNDPVVKAGTQRKRQDPRSMSRAQRRQERHGRKEAMKTQVTAANDSLDDLSRSGSMEVDNTAASQQPVFVGLNTVTKRLEQLISFESSTRRSASTQGESRQPAPAPIDTVFVCREDLNPPKLVAHFPLLVCAVNAVCHPPAERKTSLQLISLPSGAEQLLAETLQVRRCGVIALATSLLPPHLSETLKKRLLECQLTPLRAEWLDAAAQAALLLRQQLITGSSSNQHSSRFQPRPQVHQVATTAPTNLNACKLQKKHSRAEKKDWRKAKRAQAHEEAIRLQRRNHTLVRRARREDRRQKTRLSGGKANDEAAVGPGSQRPAEGVK